MNNSGDNQMLWPEVEKDLLFIIEPQISPCGGPVYFVRSLSSATDENVVDSGSFGLIDTGEMKLLITCNHVWEGFRTAHREDSNVRMLIGLQREQFPFVFDQHEPIDRDVKLDIATFDMAPLLHVCGGCKFYPLNRNPAPRVRKGNRLVFQGYQGMFRSSIEECLTSGATTYSLHVSDTSGLRMVADISKTEKKYRLSPTRAREPEASHGGISGSPCFLVRQNGAIHLVGLVTDYGQGSLWFTHARCLNSDGTINRAVD